MVPDDGYVIKECTAVEPLMSSLISEVFSGICCIYLKATLCNILCLKYVSAIFWNMLHREYFVSESNALQYDQVSSLLDLNVAMTQSLLQASKWDKEKLIDNFFGN